MRDGRFISVITLRCEGLTVIFIIGSDVLKSYMCSGLVRFYLGLDRRIFSSTSVSVLRLMSEAIDFYCKVSRQINEKVTKWSEIVSRRNFRFRKLLEEHKNKLRISTKERGKPYLFRCRILWPCIRSFLLLRY